MKIMMKIMKINLLLHESQLHKTGFDRIYATFFTVITAAIYNKMICILENLYQRRNLKMRLV